MAGLRMVGMKEVPKSAPRSVRSVRDAILWSVGANSSHGLRRTNADKRRAVEILLEDSQWAKESDRWIATATGVDHKTVSAYRAELFGPRPVRVGKFPTQRSNEKLPKAEGGGAADDDSSAKPESPVRESARDTADGGGGVSVPAEVPAASGAQEGDSSASPPNVPPEDDDTEEDRPEALTSPEAQRRPRVLCVACHGSGYVDEPEPEAAPPPPRMRAAVEAVERPAPKAARLTFDVNGQLMTADEILAMDAGGSQ